MDTLHVGVTGPSRGVTLDHWRAVEEVVVPLCHEREVVLHSGAAHGVDTAAALAALEAGARVRLWVPSAPHNEGLVERVRDCGRCDITFVLGDWRTLAEAYMARNECLAAEVSRLEAFLWSEDFYRSGEWATINRALRRGATVSKHVLRRTT